MIPAMSARSERSFRVSTLELFFDLVFVFTMTQLTGVLFEGGDAAALAQVAIVLAFVWWIYDGYAWLTNAITTDRVRYRLALLGGMGGFLVIALAIPKAYEGEGLELGLAYLAVVLLHAGMYVRGTSADDVVAILRFLPWNLVAALLVVTGGALGGTAQWVIWAVAGAGLWIHGLFTSTEGFDVIAERWVERHGLVVIVALGESIVVLGAGAADLELDGGLILVALLSLALSAALWWIYFSDERSVEHAMATASPSRRNRGALVAFGHWHYGLLLGVVVLAAGLKKAIGAPYDPLGSWVATELALGVSLFVACDVGFRRVLGIPRGGLRTAAAVAVLATIPLGSEVAAALQLAALTAIMAAVFPLESRRVTT
jgi:low temperature requirement protein LtrA